MIMLTQPSYYPEEGKRKTYTRGDCINADSVLAPFLRE